ncbi:MAG: hypothetical protein IBX72_04855 [Nitrospirae bacterium]|nr:hypothetical protein [Nitrospirota bacterium]
MNIRQLIKSLLLIFVVFSFSFLLYKEFSQKSESNATNFAETQGDKTSVSGHSVPLPENLPAREAPRQTSERDSSIQSAAKTHTSKVIAYYFHGTFRCSACRTIERYSQEAIEQYFRNELQNGTLEFRHVNVEEPDNRHFIQDYQLFTRSLVLSMETDGKEIQWKNLKAVWTHVRDRERFFQYVKDEVEGFLKETM